MWLISLGFGKTRAVQCYLKLLIWIIIVSLGLYWFLNRNGGTKENLLWTLENYHWDSKYQQNQLNYELENSETSNSNKGQEFSNTFVKLKKESKTTWGLQKKFVHFKASSASATFNNDSNFNADLPFLHSSISRLCNPPEAIQAQDENLIIPEFKLDALVIVQRHGTRAPLSHVPNQNLSLVNCSFDHPEFQKFLKFTSESMSKLGGYSQFIGPFHSFQKVPTTGQCNLGQLSQLGSWQLLKLGKTIREVYQNTLFSSSSYAMNSHNPTMTDTKTHNNLSHFQNNNNDLWGHSTATTVQNNIKVIAYSTRYRRTLQSLISFLYGLLGPKYIIQNTTIRESQSITFCFNDCSCRATETLKKLAGKKYHPNQKEKSAMIKVINRINSIIGSSEKVKKSGTTLLDLLLLYPCHKSELPCRESNQHQLKRNNEDCVQKEDMAELIALLQKENHNQKKVPASKQLALLSSYGLLKEIVNLALKMTSSTTNNGNSGGSNTPYSNNYNNNNFHSMNSKTKIAIFAGHDTTLSGLLGALGIFNGHPDIHLVPYASRLIFEFYRKTNIPPNSARKHFFRVIYNGQAVTHLVRFCQENDRVVLASSSSHLNNNKQNSKLNDNDRMMRNRNMLCPFESLVRFLHDHYFESFGNSTNFKDACLRTYPIQQKKRKK